MMPQCNKNGCNKVAKVYLGKVIKNLEDEEKWEDPLYLCEKCAKKFIIMFIILTLGFLAGKHSKTRFEGTKEEVIKYLSEEK